MTSDRLVLVAAAVAVGLSGCCMPGLCSDPSIVPDSGPSEPEDGGDGGSSTGGVQPTLSDIQAKIFTPTCATAYCHSSGEAANSGSLDLSSADKSYAQLVNQPAAFVGVTATRVVPGSPQTSFLIVKLVGLWQNMNIADGAPMPYGGTELAADQQQAIQDWIAAGAQNN